MENTIQPSICHPDYCNLKIEECDSKPSQELFPQQLWQQQPLINPYQRCQQYTCPPIQMAYEYTIEQQKQFENLIQQQQFSQQQYFQSICFNNQAGQAHPEENFQLEPKKFNYPETKNIPKNYSRAIVRYIKTQQEKIAQLLGDIPFEDFASHIQKKRNHVISIKEFKQLCVDKGDEKTRKMNKVFRTMAFKFLREHFITYVFGNKKVKYSYNLIKYRTIFIKMLSYPDEFYALKI